MDSPFLPYLFDDYIPKTKYYAPMEENEREKQLIVEEIQRRIAYLVSTDQIPDSEKLIIARDVLNMIEHGERAKED